MKSIPVHCRHDKLEPASALKPNPRNPRTHPKAEIEALAEIIRKTGWRRPVTVSKRSGFIVVGHGAVEAAKILGCPVPVEMQTFKDAAEEQAHMIADNRLAELAAWNDDVLGDLLRDLKSDIDLTGFEATDLERLLENAAISDEPPEPKIDQAAELLKRWKVKRGDIWHLGDHRLLCGDSTKADDVRLLLGSDKPEIMVTDPPYGVEYDPAWRHAAGVNKSSRVGKVANDERASWASAWAHFDGDVAYVWHGGTFGAVVQRSLSACGFEIRAQIIWVKKRFALSRGHYHWRHEPCFFAVRSNHESHWGGGYKQQTVWADIVDHWDPKRPMFAGQVDENLLVAFDAARTTVWDISASDGSPETVHGTQKPVECMARPMRNHDCSIVYDPFSGSGTTLIAAERTFKRCLAIELEPKYVAVALQRFLDETGKAPTR